MNRTWERVAKESGQQQKATCKHGGRRATGRRVASELQGTATFPAQLPENKATKQNRHISFHIIGCSEVLEAVLHTGKRKLSETYNSQGQPTGQGTDPVLACPGFCYMRGKGLLTFCKNIGLLKRWGLLGHSGVHAQIPALQRKRCLSEGNVGIAKPGARGGVKEAAPQNQPGPLPTSHSQDPT